MSVLLWLDSKSVKEPYSKFVDNKKLTIKLPVALTTSNRSWLSLIELNVKNVRNGLVGTHKEVVYLYCDLAQPSLVNGEQRQVIGSIVKPTGTAWGHKFFESTEPIRSRVWPGEHHELSVWLGDSDQQNIYSCDYLTALLRIEA